MVHSACCIALNASLNHEVKYQNELFRGELSIPLPNRPGGLTRNLFFEARTGEG